MLLFFEVLKKLHRDFITWLSLKDVFEIRELFQTGPDVSESNKGFWLSSSCIFSRKTVLIAMAFVAVAVADVAT